jgi:3-phosphoshikimate 1-carboxyvinyltransferase
MPLPKLIEIVPFSPAQLQNFALDGKADITIPGSKSITNRAIVLAALGDGVVTLNGALWSEDTEAMTDCMRRLGVNVEVAEDPDVSANRIITVHGCSGKLPNGGTEEAPLELFVANAGTAARFLTAMVCLGGGVYRLSGVPRMHERPQKELIRALRALGYRIDTPNDMLPAVVFGGGARPGPVTVSVDDSSQFASALLLSSRVGGWDVATPPDANPDELPYVEMTRRMVETFPHAGGAFQVARSHPH